jgi:hypothetical protein
MELLSTAILNDLNQGDSEVKWSFEYIDPR